MMIRPALIIGNDVTKSLGFFYIKRDIVQH